MKKAEKNTKKKKLVILPGGIVPLWMPIDEDEIPVFRESKASDALSRVLDGSLKSSYIARHRNELLRDAVKKDCADALPVLMPAGRRLSPERFDELVSLASESGSPECAAWLLRYRRSHYSDADFEAVEQKRFDTELGLAEPGLSYYRKMFRVSYVAGGIHIGKPKEGSGEIRVPASIGGTPVVSVDREAFYGLGPSAVISREWPADDHYASSSTDEIPFSEIVPGGIIHLGRYRAGRKAEQPIPWRVLERDENSLLVISDAYVATLPYNAESEETSWETCDLRRWLNGAFLPLSFTESERQLIVPCEVKAAASRRFGTEAGNDTRDCLYIPDLDEIPKLLPTDESRRTGSWWWLRTPGCNKEFAACVSPDGRLVSVGNFTDSVYGVRPLMRVSL